MEKMNTYLTEYLNQLDSKQKIAYEIAKSHLATTFDIEKTNGFKEFLDEKRKKELQN